MRRRLQAAVARVTDGQDCPSYVFRLHAPARALTDGQDCPSYVFRLQR